MEFRPCIDIHNGKVKQIVGGSLKDEGNQAKENFVAEQDAAYFAEFYKKDKIRGGHIILLNPSDSSYYKETKRQALLALHTYPGGMQVGGGIHAENAKEFIEAGASHVIVTSYVFKDGKVNYNNLEKILAAVGKEHLVLDLSCRKADVYLPRCMSAFVGADITTAILGSGLTETDRIPGADGSRKEAAAAIDTNVSCGEMDGVSAARSGRSRLMVDVGTNGEIVLFHKERLICCATAAGPAFEGAGLSCGMRGVAGAIDHVNWENGSWKVHVIGDREASTAKGICGSGVIDGVAGLLESGLLEDTGYLEEDVCFAGNVGLTAEDIREVQLAKGAIRAGMETLLAEEKMDAAGLEGLYVAGGFGSYMSSKSAERIGLFPKIDLSRIKICGNAALAGAVRILHDRRLEKEATALAERAKTINLGSSAKFQEFYMKYMMFDE